MQRKGRRVVPERSASDRIDRSGRPDSNRRTSATQTRRSTRLSYAPVGRVWQPEWAAHARRPPPPAPGLPARRGRGADVRGQRIAGPLPARRRHLARAPEPAAGDGGVRAARRGRGAGGPAEAADRSRRRAADGVARPRRRGDRAVLVLPGDRAAADQRRARHPVHGPGDGAAVAAVRARRRLRPWRGSRATRPPQKSRPCPHGLKAAVGEAE